jgi:hypothetical protein
MNPNQTIKQWKRARYFATHTKSLLPLALAMLFPLLASCSRKADVSVQRASEELKRLASVAEVGPNYTEFSDRVLTAKGSMDIALEHATDSQAKAKIEWAMNFYIDARKAWNTDPTLRSQAPEIKELLQMAVDASQVACAFTNANNQMRSDLEVKAQNMETKRSERALRARKVSDAIRILNQLRVVDSAIDQYAIEENKSKGESVAEGDWMRHISRRSTLFPKGGVDVLGNPFGPQTVDTLPRVPKASKIALSDVVDETFWSPYN